MPEVRRLQSECMEHIADKTMVVGWREWVALPGLGIPALKAKVDTGARTSALHAYMVEPFTEHGRERVRFGLRPLRKRPDIEILCEADIYDRRIVSDSGGHREERYIIRTPLLLGNSQWDIEISLTNRDTMLFRMLLGRTAMSGRLAIDPGQSYCTGKSLRQAYAKAYSKQRYSGASKRRKP